jgi:energy-coupling factor transporter transmembrane protein EcfT
MLHPTVRLICWGAAVVATQIFPLHWLLAASAAVFPLAALLAGQRFFLLVRRARWLLASLALVFALATPGVDLIPALGSIGPSREGVTLGLIHLLRLTLVLAALALVLRITPLEELVEALYGLLRPLAWLGLDRARIALRLLLVLRYVEQPHGGDWRGWLEQAQAPAESEVIELRCSALARVDFLVLTGLAAGVVWAIMA